jgi:putative ABC transport system permease protein
MADLRYALRTLLKNPGFAFIAMLTLALGIGANTAIFSVVNGVLLRPLPFPDAERLVQVWTSSADEKRSNHAAADFLDMQRENQSLTAVAAYRVAPFTVVPENGQARATEGSIVTLDFFDVLAVPARYGRTFSRTTDRIGGERYAVLSGDAARRLYTAEEKAVGQVLKVNAQTYTVLGVLPDGAEWPGSSRIWTLADKEVPPSPVETSNDVADREIRYFEAIGRLKPGVSLEQASQDMGRLSAILQGRRSAASAQRQLAIGPVREQLVGDIRFALLVLQGAVGLVLLIACANVSSLLLARATGRRRELAVRAALGAGQGRLIRQLLTESLVLGAVGGFAGLLLGAWLIIVLVDLLPPGIPRLREITLDRVVGISTLITALATGVLFGVMPALQAGRTNASAALKSGGERGSSGRARARAALVVTEVALTLVLLACAGLLVNSFLRLQNVDTGFDPENVVVTAFMLPEARYSTNAARGAFYTRLIESVSAQGGVEAAAVGFPGPLRGSNASGSFDVEGRRSDNSSERPYANLGSVSGGYFKAMGIPLLSGRTFNESDTRDAPGVVIVSRSLANQHWPGEDAVGRRLRFDDDPNAPWITVVGVVDDVHQLGLDKGATPLLYFPYEQFTLPFTNLFVRSSAPEGTVTAMLRAQFAALDRELPVDDMKTLQRIVDNSVAHPRFRTLLVSAFALVALALAAVGVFGLINFSVTQRTREIGIRMAMGATPKQVLGPMIREGLTLAIIGTAIGLVGALLVSRVLATFLFGVGTTDPLTFATVAVVLLTVALLATYIPARRALRVDPITALRVD